MRLALAAIDDEAPQVRVQLVGIGTAITPHARLPIIGEISDDYGVAKAWFESHVDDGEPVDQPFEAKIEGQDRLPVDEAIEVERFALEPKHKFHLVGRGVGHVRIGRWTKSRHQPALCARRRHARTIAIDARSPRAAAPPAFRNHRPGTDRIARRPGAHRHDGRRREPPPADKNGKQPSRPRCDRRMPPAADSASAADRAFDATARAGRTGLAKQSTQPRRNARPGRGL